jgi:glyoxylase-like metal-dependent hydrolase (beta-lactamase superfamily II)
MLDNPVAIVRAALGPAAKLSNMRKQKGQELVDLTTPQGDKLRLAFDSGTHLPASVSWMNSSDNLGDIVNTTTFSDYETVNGIKLPKHYLTKIDFHDWVSADIQVSKNTVDGPVADLAAPAAIKSAAVPAPAPVFVTAEQVGKGIWWLAGSGNHRSVVFEFDDHLTLFEAPFSEARSKAVIDKARTLVPGKPLTEVIVSHHHFDHTGGLRVAVAEGLTIITERGNEGFFKEVVARKATLHPDELARNPKPLKTRLVDDELILKDKSQEVDVYHVRNNSHAPLLLMAYAPQQKVFVQGDLYDVGWTQHPWADNYQENLTLRHIDFDKDAPIHGKVQTRAEELAAIAATKK